VICSLGRSRRRTHSTAQRSSPGGERSANRPAHVIDEHVVILWCAHADERALGITAVVE
jgi:hypothetical protein